MRGFGASILVAVVQLFGMAAFAVDYRDPGLARESSAGDLNRLSVLPQGPSRPHAEDQLSAGLTSEAHPQGTWSEMPGTVGGDGIVIPGRVWTSDEFGRTARRHPLEAADAPVEGSQAAP